MDIIIIEIVFSPKDDPDRKHGIFTVYGNNYTVDILACYMEMTTDI